MLSSSNEITISQSKTYYKWDLVVEKIVWDQTYSVGHPLLDEQHKKIICIINSLLESPNLQVNSDAVSDSLSLLKKYSEEHFKAEEHILKAYGYPDLVSHKEGHLEYTTKVINLYKHAIQGNSSVPEELLSFLTYWWQQHILFEDMAYKDFLLAQKI